VELRAGVVPGRPDHKEDVLLCSSELTATVSFVIQPDRVDRVSLFEDGRIERAAAQSARVLLER